MSRPSLRAAAAHDAAAIARVHIAAWQCGYRGLIPDDVLDGLELAERTLRWERNLSTSPPRTLVAECAGHVCGFVSYGPARDHDVGPTSTGEVWSLYVDPAAWGAGYGRRLLQRACRELSNEGFAEAVLWVLAGNERARRFYESHGFKPDGASRVESIGAPLPSLRYRAAFAG